jgi:hypothetical protein
MSRDDATAGDIIKACDLIGQFISGRTKDVFLADAKTQSAVLHQLLSSAKLQSVCRRSSATDAPDYRGA